MNHDAIAGCLLGTAVGDALGLPYEGLSSQRASRLLGPPNRFRFFFGKGVVSDDTEHACLTWLALRSSGGSDVVFASELAASLRSWFLALPPGTGMATARACMKLCLGWGPLHSGVFSAGNGPAMRAPVLGAALDDLDQLQRFVRIATRITHTDPRAEHAALAIALAAWTSRREPAPVPQSYFALVRERLANESADEFLNTLDVVELSLANGQSTAEFAVSHCGPNGVSGYALHTVPVVLHAWLSHPRDWKTAVTSIIQFGGDADSTAAILGGILGAGTGPSGIPAQWIAALIEWPNSVRHIRRITEPLLADQPFPKHHRLLWYVPILIRNLLVLFVILLHGLRRLLPPY